MTNFSLILWIQTQTIKVHLIHKTHFKVTSITSFTMKTMFLNFNFNRKCGFFSAAQIQSPPGSSSASMDSFNAYPPPPQQQQQPQSQPSTAGPNVPVPAAYPPQPNAAGKYSHKIRINDAAKRETKLKWTCKHKQFSLCYS